MRINVAVIIVTATRPIVRFVAVLGCIRMKTKLECGPMPNVMAALPNIGGALCSTPQFGSRPLLECRAVTLPRHETR